jgi:putative DNA primase/helicase
MLESIQQGAAVASPEQDHGAGHFKNDTGFADAFVARHRAVLRYVANEKVWLTFTPANGWSRDNTGKAAKALAIAYSRALYAWALEKAKTLEPKAGIALAQAMTSLGNRARIEPMLAFAECNPNIIVRAEQLDRDEWLVGVENGVVDIRTGSFSKHSAENLITRRLGAAFDPKATAPVFEKFLAEVQPEIEMRQFLQRWAGLCLTGSPREHVLPFHHGCGGNGKGIFLEHCLLKLMGAYGAKMTDSLVYANERGTPPHLEIAGLCGKRLALGEENAAGAGLNEKFLKAATGADLQKGRMHYADFVEYNPTAKIALVGNHKPRVEGRDLGFWRRFLLVDWGVTIPIENQDTELSEKLKAELPGILNWALSGARDWLAGGLRPPQSCRAATARFRADSDPLAGFTEQFKTADEGWILKAAIFEKYQSWADEEGIPKNRHLTKRTLGFRLAERGWNEGRVGHRMDHAWLGISEKEDADADV